METLRKVLQVLRFLLLEVVPFGVAVYQHWSRGDSRVYWPYREKPERPPCSRQ